jgi:predicted ATPase
VSPRLTHIAVENYRCLGSVRLEPDPNLTFIQGNNASGKSSLLDAVALLADLLRQGRDSPYAGAQRGAPRRSDRFNLRDLLWDPSRPARWDLGFTTEDGRMWRYTLSLRARGGGEEVVEEQLQLRVGDAWESVLETDSRGARVRLSLEGEAGWQPATPAPGVPLLARTNDPLQYPDVAPAAAFLRGVQLVRLNPTLMRGPDESIDEDTLPSRYGEDLSSRLRLMVTRFHRNVGPWLSIMQQRFGWVNIEVPPSPGSGEPRIQEAEGAPFSALSLWSDGQVVSAWMAVVAQVPPRSLSVLLLDEPAVALSRDAQENFAEWLDHLAVRFQVVAATHSRELVDDGGRRDSTWFIERDWGQASRLVRLSEHEPSRRFPGVFPPGTVADELMRGNEAWGEE